MKIMKKMLLLLIFVVLFNCKGVFAAGKTIKYKDFEITISKVYIDAVNSRDSNDKTDIDITNMVTLKPELMVFDAKQYDDSDNYVIYINPGIKISENELLELLEPYNLPLNESRFYYLDFFVEFSLKNTSGFYEDYYTEYYYHTELSDDDKSYFDNNVLSQVYDTVVYKLVDNSPQLDYDEQNYKNLSTHTYYTYYTTWLYGKDGRTYTELSFIGFDDLVDVYKTLCDRFPEDYKFNGVLDRIIFKDEPASVEEIVPIPNTFESSSLVYVVGGSILFLLGGVLILKTVKTKKVYN